MPTNDFIPYSTGGGANVESQAAYVAAPSTATGQVSGIAPSAVFNKIWRQGNFIASAVAQLVSTTLSVDTLDDGDQAGFITKLSNMIKSLAWTSAVLTNGSTATTQTVGDNSTKIATTAFVKGASGTQVGDVWWRAVSTPGTNELECNGASLSTTTYATLFAVIGYNFGGSGGSFLLPDLRGYFIRGWNDAGSVDPLRVFGSLQTDAFKAHTHTIAYCDTNSGSDGPGHGNSLTQYENSGSTGDTETRPVNYALLPVIRYQ